MKILIKGAGDLATGVAWVLKTAGMQVVMTELERPTVIRRSVSFAEAMFEGKTTVEGIRAVKSDMDSYRGVLGAGDIPVLADPEARVAGDWKPEVLVDAILAKKNLGTSRGDAPLVIGMGPGFSAGDDVDLVIETMRGHDLGRIITRGEAIPNTNTPGEIGGESDRRVLRAPAEGLFRPEAAIGDRVKTGQVLARVEGSALTAPFEGVLRGILHDGLPVFRGMKVGDVDPRDVRDNCFTISDKARALGGAVLCASLGFGGQKQED